jgi:hypothetical protein
MSDTRIGQKLRKTPVGLARVDPAVEVSPQETWVAQVPQWASTAAGLARTGTCSDGSHQLLTNCFRNETIHPD